jgi:L-aminopeptidase/D-esterase-like protein
VLPAHTRFDGDCCFAVATGIAEGHLDRARELAAVVTAAAIRDAVAPG